MSASPLTLIQTHLPSPIHTTYLSLCLSTSQSSILTCRDGSKVKRSNIQTQEHDTTNFSKVSNRPISDTSRISHVKEPLVRHRCREPIWESTSIRILPCWSWSSSGFKRWRAREGEREGEEDEESEEEDRGGWSSYPPATIDIVQTSPDRDDIRIDEISERPAGCGSLSDG